MLNAKLFGNLNYKGKIFLFKTRDVSSLVKAVKKRGGEVTRKILKKDMAIEVHIQLFELGKNQGMANVFFRLAIDGLPLIPVVTFSSLTGDEDTQLAKIFMRILTMMNENWWGWDSMLDELEKPIYCFHPIEGGIDNEAEI